MMCGSPHKIRRRMGQLWPKRKQSGVSTSKWWIQNDICVTFTQRKVEHFHSEKETKRCGIPYKITVMYEIKGNKEVYIVNERGLCDSYTKLNGTVPLENWKIFVAAHTWMKGVTFTQKKENMVQRVYDICDSHK